MGGWVTHFDLASNLARQQRFPSHNCQGCSDQSVKSKAVVAWSKCVATNCFLLNAMSHHISIIINTINTIINIVLIAMLQNIDIIIIDDVDLPFPSKQLIDLIII